MSHRLHTRIPVIALASVLTLILSVVFTTPAVAGPERDASVGSEGELYVVSEGTYGELFPDQGLANPDSPALALEVTHPDGTSERFLVPGTETEDVEDSASILFEEQSGTLFVLWQTKKNVIHSRLNLVGLRDGDWTETVEISGRPFGWKSSPQLAVTRDAFDTVEPHGGLRTWQRTVVHLLWRESGGDGEPFAFYSPIVLLDGVYTGWNPVLRLDEFELDAGTSPVAEFNLALASAARIEAGRDGRNVVIGFVLPETGELATLTVEILPGEFAFLADEIRHQVIDIGREVETENPAVLADRVRHQIIDIGNRLGLHPSVPSYAAQMATVEIEGSPAGEEPVKLADRVRHQIIDIGARLTSRGFDRERTTSKLQVLETANSRVEEAPPNLIRVGQASIRSAPMTGPGENTLFLSEDAREVLVSWNQAGTVFYRESRGDGWSAARSLRLGGQLDLARALEILEQRADERAGE